MLKAARAFLVFKGLEGKGEIIKSVPSVQDIEDERFDFDFSMVLITKENLEAVKKAILSVSEIDSVYVSEIKAEEIVLPKEEAVEQKHENEMVVGAGDLPGHVCAARHGGPP